MEIASLEYQETKSVTEIAQDIDWLVSMEIGRASCRERVCTTV